MTEFNLQLTPEAVKALSYAVNEAIRMWPGSPARPAREQEVLYALKVSIFAMNMELTLDSDEGEA
jgi:hypothetical protein